MERLKNRSYGIMKTAPQDTLETVNRMIDTNQFKYPEMMEYLATQGINVSRSTFSRYARDYIRSREIMYVMKENFKVLVEQVEQNPDLDYTSVLSCISAQQLLGALVRKEEKDWDAVGAEKIVSQINSLINAVAYKKRIEVQNKDKLEAAADGLRNEMFVALAREKPELFADVDKFLKRKVQEGAQ